MSKNIIIAIIFSLIVGGGFGYSIGRSNDPFARGPEALGSKDTYFDKRFLDQLINHHEEAIAMAKIAQKNSERKEITEMANVIIDVDTKKIEELRQWENEWYGNR